jgi:hypothetical protein
MSSTAVHGWACSLACRALPTAESAGAADSFARCWIGCCCCQKLSLQKVTAFHHPTEHTLMIGPLP